ncbi:MAG: type VI secretion system protein TssR, partial [Bacteroidales bacterium]|nr:type VI secretion system protein TssR [Bacteroidales bacterium]
MKKNVFLIVFLIIVYIANAQLPSIAMKTPYKIKTYPTQQTINQISSGDVSNMDMMEGFWNVFSDRNENATYDAPNSRRTKDVLGFLDRVTIAEIRGDWAHVYQETYQQKFPVISNQAKDLGWIKMENLILSEYALKNNNNFTRKAMVLTTLTSGGSVNEEYNRFYSNPELRASKVTPNYAKTFEIYFILKVEGKRYLICKSDKVVGGESEAKGNILGWIDEKNLTFWDHRVCLEPSWLPEAIAEYANKRMLIFAPDKKNSAISFFNGEMVANHIRSLELKSTRESGYTYRLPIIETDPSNNNICKVGTIGNVSERDSKEEDRLRKKLQDSKNKAQNINILFVIDGTNSMKDYFAPAAQSIARSISQIKARNSQNNLKFGALVYRDYADGKDAAVLKKLTSNHDEVIGFLNGTQCFSKASEWPEAMFNGLIEGVKNCGFRQGESNLVILIGDAGNHVPDPKRKSIEYVLKEMLRFDCNFVAFQVNNGSHRSHDYFIEQARNIMLDNANNILKKYGYNDRFSVNDENKNTYKLYIENKQKIDNDLFIIGRFTFADKGSSINTRELERAVEQTIVDYNELTAKLISGLENVLNTMGGFTDEFKAWMR